MKSGTFNFWLVFFSGTFAFSPLLAGDSPAAGNVMIMAVEGKAEILTTDKKGKKESIPVSTTVFGYKVESGVSKEERQKLDDAPRTDLRTGETLRTGEGETATILIPGEGIAHLAENSEIRLPEPREKTAEPGSASPDLELLKGKLFLSIDRKRVEERERPEFRLKTPATILAVKGTRFFAAIEETGNKTTTGVNEGTVEAIRIDNGEQIRREIPAGIAFVFSPDGVASRPLSPEEQDYSDIYDGLDGFVQVKEIENGKYVDWENDEILLWQYGLTYKDTGWATSWERANGFRITEMIEFSHPRADYNLEKLAKTVRLTRGSVMGNRFEMNLVNDWEARTVGVVEILVRGTGIRRIGIKAMYPTNRRDWIVVPLTEQWTAVSIPFDFGPDQDRHADFYLSAHDVDPWEEVESRNQKYRIEYVPLNFYYSRKPWK